jgi:hypothetical protein
MKKVVIVLLGICATACIDGRNSNDRIELRLSSGMTARIAKSGPENVRMTYMGRTIRYEQGALYVDEQRLTLPADARVVAFDGPNIYVDGRNIAAL